MELYYSRLCSAAVLSLTLVSPLTVAQSSTSSDNTAIDEVVVTGEYLYSDQLNSLRILTPILDVPQSLSIITAEQIDEQGFTSIGDIVNYTPGVNNSQGEGHRDSVVFRGVRSTADFYIDGARDDVQYFRPLYNLEQVEILRGPNALLFGRGGTGGILNRVTKKGEVGESFTDFSIAAGTFGDYGIEIDANIDTGDTSAVRINAFYEELENHRDFFDGERFGFNPTAHFEFGSDTTLDVSYELIDHERFIDRGIPTDENGDPVEAFEDTVFGDSADNFTTIEADVFRASLQHQFSDSLKGNFSAFYGDYDKTYQNYFPSAFFEAGSINNTSASGAFDQIQIDGYVDNTERENFILSGNLVGEFDLGSTEHSFVVGIEYIDTSSDQDRFNTVFESFDPAATFPDGTTDQITIELNNGFNLTNGVIADDNGNILATNIGFGINGFGDGFGADDTAPGAALNDRTFVDIETTSFYFQDEIAITENFLAVIGARFDNFDIDVFNLDNGQSISRSDNEVSPRAGLIYKPSDNLSFYASYSESFLPRSGEQFTNFTSDGDSDNVDPDVFENQEIGVKWDFMPGLSLTAAYFDNEQESATDTRQGDGTFEVRGLEVDGFEIQLKGSITDQLHIIAGYSNMDGITDNGAELPRELPENTFSAWASYDVNQDFGFGLGLTYQDESFATDFDIGNDESTHPTLPSYTKVDASAYYNISEAFRLQLNIENLTDELYFPNSHTANNVTVGESVNARLSLTGRF